MLKHNLPSEVNDLCLIFFTLKKICMQKTFNDLTMVFKTRLQHKKANRKKSKKSNYLAEKNQTKNTLKVFFLCFERLL